MVRDPRTKRILRPAAKGEHRVLCATHLSLPFWDFVLSSYTFLFVLFTVRRFHFSKLLLPLSPIFLSGHVTKFMSGFFGGGPDHVRSMAIRFVRGRCFTLTHFLSLVSADV